MPMGSEVDRKPLACEDALLLGFKKCFTMLKSAIFLLLMTETLLLCSRVLPRLLVVLWRDVGKTERYVTPTLQDVPPS